MERGAWLRYLHVYFVFSFLHVLSFFFSFFICCCCFIVRSRFSHTPKRSHLFTLSTCVSCALSSKNSNCEKKTRDEKSTTTTTSVPFALAWTTKTTSATSKKNGVLFFSPALPRLLTSANTVTMCWLKFICVNWMIDGRAIKLCKKYQFGEIYQQWHWSRCFFLVLLLLLLLLRFTSPLSLTLSPSVRQRRVTIRYMHCEMYKWECKSSVEHCLRSACSLSGLFRWF